jgi:small subunit ribosomal protein S18
MAYGKQQSANSNNNSTVYVGARAKRQDMAQRPKKRRNILGSEARYVDYMDIKLLDRFINDQGKILPRRITGLTAFQQRLVTRAVKYARHLAMMTFVEQDMN